MVFVATTAAAAAAASCFSGAARGTSAAGTSAAAGLTCRRAARCMEARESCPWLTLRYTRLIAEAEEGGRRVTDSYISELDSSSVVAKRETPVHVYKSKE